MKPEMTQKPAGDEKGAAGTSQPDGFQFGEVVSLNTPQLDVSDASQEIVATQANICSKTCNSN